KKSIAHGILVLRKEEKAVNANYPGFCFAQNVNLLSDLCPRQCTNVDNDHILFRLHLLPQSPKDIIGQVNIAESAADRIKCVEEIELKNPIDAPHQPENEQGCQGHLCPKMFLHKLRILLGNL